MTDERLNGVRNAIRNSNLSTYQIADVFEVDHETVMRLLAEEVEYAI